VEAWKGFFLHAFLHMFKNVNSSTNASARYWNFAHYNNNNNNDIICPSLAFTLL
jgi:hypothetical protein